MAVHAVSKTAKLHIGTSGWSYAHWSRGRFYPQGLKQTDWLGFYAGHYDTVEVNTTFYHLPRESLVDGWRERAPEHFQFGIKMWRRVTHLKKLLNVGEDLDIFFQRIMRLKPTQLGPLLVQLPPSLHCDAIRLEEFLTTLRERSAGYPWKVTIEFRHPSWYCDEMTEVLDRHGVAVCLHDHTAGPVDNANNVPLVYLRRHGGIGNYQGSYTPTQIQRDAESIQRWLAEGREIYVYYDNDVEGYAIDNSRQLIEATERKKARR